MIAFTTRTPFLKVWRTNFSWLSLSYVLLTPVSLLLARLYTTKPPILGGWGGWPVILFLIPLYYSRYYWDEYVKIQDAFSQTVEMLMATIDAKDAYTRMHSERVAAIAEDLAKALKLSDTDVAKIKLGSRVHDIGKIAIPDRVLLKPGKLTDEEYSLIKAHTLMGVELLKLATFLEDIMPIVRSHHERWDGKGYPDGLAGGEIPLWARIVALADAYEAMTAGRPYRPARSPEEALAEILAHSGTQFDPELVEIFKELWEEDPIWKDREVFLREYSSRVSSLVSPLALYAASGSKTTRGQS